MVIYGPNMNNVEINDTKMPALEKFYSRYGFSSLEINNNDNNRNYADTKNCSK